jgi:Tfp pilus assembly protein FimT
MFLVILCGLLVSLILVAIVAALALLEVLSGTPPSARPAERRCRISAQRGVGRGRAKRQQTPTIATLAPRAGTQQGE